MELSYATFLIFTLLSLIRVFSYFPQIAKIASDKNGASAISLSTWGLWTAAHVATLLYAAINLRDLYLTAVSALYAACCVCVILLTVKKRRALQRSTSSTKPFANHAMM